MDTRRGSVVVFPDGAVAEDMQDEEDEYDSRTPLDKTIDKIGMGMLFSHLVKLALNCAQVRINGLCLDCVASVCITSWLLAAN